MKVAVSGARGFVGRHVVAELERRQIEATLLVRHATGATAAPRPGVVEFDLLQEPGDLYERLGRPDVLLHLAWGGLPNYDSLHHVEQRPAHFRLIQSLVRAGLPHALVTGTCFEYGLQSGPLHEDLPCQPINAYGQAKDSLRRELALLARQQPFQLTWARLFYLYGEGQSVNSLWPALHSAAARGDKVFPMSGGEQLRDYLPVELAACHLVDLALRPQGAGTVNVCSGLPVSVRALVEGWIRQQGWPIAPELGRYAYPTHEPMAFWGDATRLQQLRPPS
jgi:nucleoside-diphosphate-sugar epimerase